MQLHMPTLVITFSLITYLCTAIIIFNYSYVKNKYLGVFEFVLSYILFSIAITLVLLSPYLSDIWRILMSNVFMYASMLLFIYALSRFYGRDFSRKIYFTLIISFIILYIKFTIISPNVNARIVIFAIFAVCGYLHMTIMSYRENKEYDTKKFAIITFISMLIYIIRIPMALYSDIISSYIFSSHTDSILILMVLMNLLLLTFGLLLLIQNRLNSDIKKYDEQQNQLLSELQIQANTDNLTNLMNRRKIEFELGKLMCKEAKCRETFSLILIDIDYFKKVNDIYGHSVGDDVLVKLSEILIYNLCGADLIGRWGGEEFIIVMPGKNLEEAFLIAEKLRRLVSLIKLDVFKDDTKITISSGVLEFQNESDIKSIISKVDKLLYNAKNAGRDLTMAG